MASFDVIVIGQGYAGLAVAKAANERGLKVASIENNCMGGLILNINELDPATDAPEHSGAELSSALLMAMMEAGVESLSETVTSVEQNSDGAYVVQTDEEQHEARNVILATGARLRKLGIPGEEEYFGRGVSECADCDGPLYKDQDTVVVGGGDSAFQEALGLAPYARSVTILMRGTQPRARAYFVERVAAEPKIRQRFGCELTAIEGDESGVTGVRISTPEGEETIPLTGVFIFAGLVPNTAFLGDALERDENGAIITSDTCETSLPGLWAVGAARQGFGGLLTDADQDAARVLQAIG